MWIPAALIPARVARDPWSRHLAARLACSLAAAVILVAMPGLVSAVAGWVDVRCLFLTLTGWPCPGCGVTTSLMALASGDVVRAAWANPAGIVVATALATQGIVAARGAWRRGEPHGRAWLERQDRLVLAVLAASWIVRLSSGR